jgi:hypothetical protein
VKNRQTAKVLVESSRFWSGREYSILIDKKKTADLPEEQISRL